MIKKTSNLALKPIFCLLVLLQANQSFGKDFGKMANTFVIKEEGFVAMMQRKLQAVDIEKENKKMTKIAKERVASPRPVPLIQKAEETRTFYFDPTYTLLEDIILPNGQVLHKAGKEVNPLDHMKLNRRMFFIDARDKEQINWLKKNLEKEETKQSKASETEAEPIENKVILTAGKIFEIKKELKEEMNFEEIYFDQAGELTTRFGIKAVPAIAVEENKKIRITEFNIEKDKED